MSFLKHQNMLVSTNKELGKSGYSQLSETAVMSLEWTLRNA